MNLPAQQSPAATAGTPVDDASYRAICERLYAEADLLSRQDYEGWLALMAPTVRYRVPLRTFQQRGQERAYGGDSAWYDESLESLRFRAMQSKDPATNAERVPSFLRYFVTNILAHEVTEGLAVHSQVLLLRVRANQPTPFFLSGARQDVWRAQNGELLLAEREVMLDAPGIEASNFAFFL